jgi:hypothetical protein
MLAKGFAAALATALSIAVEVAQCRSAACLSTVLFDTPLELAGNVSVLFDGWLLRPFCGNYGVDPSECCR